MKAEEYIRCGNLDQALAELQNAIRSKPDDWRLRVFLFQLQCVLGNWEKALTQLNVLASLGNPDTFLLTRIFQPVLACELLRAEIFEGKRTPIIFGEPMEWVGSLVQANGHIARGELQAAQGLREQALEAAPATSGKVDGNSFEWIADADSRFGPVLEAIIEGHYYWVPFCRLKQISIAPPTDLRDLVWVPAQFTWSNGGQASGHIPTRYPGTEDAADGNLRMARITQWNELAAGCFVGRGQRLFATDNSEYGILECRTIDLDSVSG